MKRFICTALLLSGHLFGETLIEQKKVIANLKKELESSKDKGAVKAKLALAYWKDQDQGLAVKTFLEALELTKAGSEPPMNKAEEALYNKAIKDYLIGSSPKETSEKILSQYSAQQKPDYYRMGYLIAIAKANHNELADFFPLFYKSYQVIPNHYLAFKTKAILHIKMMEKAPIGPEKEKEKKLAIANLIEAEKRFPQDTSLYKMQIALADDQQKGSVLEASLKKIIDRNMMTPRMDIPFYAQIGLAHHKDEIVQRYLNKAREWYPSSRLIDAAEKQLKNKGS